MSSVSRKNTQVAPTAPPPAAMLTSMTSQQQQQPQDEAASRITPVEQSTSASPTPTVKERPRSNFSFPPLPNVYLAFFGGCWYNLFLV